ncbi:MAG: phosphatidate cytidylyltransferase [Woeseiaceae bacterium]|nr:phosphatidate cytidylyltransferase [Woeseiaceae bacterium]
MLKQRIFTAVIAVAVLGIVLFVAPPAVAEAVIALLIIAGAWEWSGFLQATGQRQKTAFLITLVVLVGIASAASEQQVELVLQAALAWWFIAFVWTFLYPTPIPAVIRWVGGMLVLVPLYLALVELYQAGPLTLLFLLLIVWAADIGAFFAGKAFGRVKLAPQISPGKTWEGVIGGLVLVVLLTVARSFVIDSNLASLIPFCLAVAAISIVGDLTVSMFKRSAGLKDSGRLFPGHGGILDRIDSVAAAAPLFVLGMHWLETLQ